MLPTSATQLAESCMQSNDTDVDLMDLLLENAPCLDNVTSYKWDANDTASLTQLLQDFKKSLYLFHEPRTVILLCLYALVFVLSVIGNSLVITVILSQKGQRSSTSLFLLVMALSDLLVATVCVPTTMAQAVYRGWLLGEILCKLTAYAQGVAVASSIYTVVLMILDRFLSIRHSVLLKRMNAASYTKIAVVFILIISGLFMIPLLSIRTTESVDILPLQSVYFCVERWSNDHKQMVFSMANFAFVYVIPCGLMTALYSVLGTELWSTEPDRMMQRRDSAVSVASSRAIIGRRRVARTSVFVAAVFVLCWLPYHIFDAIVDVEYRHTNSSTLAGLHFTMWLAHANCAIKPVLYCFMGTTFRRKMIKLVKKCNPVCKQQVFTVAYQNPLQQLEMDPNNFQWTLADYGLAHGASPRPSFASWNTSLPSPMSCYSLHWPLYDHTPRASISTQSRSYQHSPRSSVGFLNPHDEYSPRGSFCTEIRGDNQPAMCFLDTPPFLSPRTSVSMDRRGSSVSQQRSPRPSISIDPSRKSPRIAVSFEDNEASYRSPRGSISTDERIYRIQRSPRHSFCSDESVYHGPPGRQFDLSAGRQFEEKQMYLTTNPYYYYPHEERRGSRRSSAFSEHNLLSPSTKRRRTFSADDRQQMRKQSMSASHDMHMMNRDTQPPEVVYSSPTPPVPNHHSPDHSDGLISPDNDDRRKKMNVDRHHHHHHHHHTESEDDFSPSEMITYNNSRRHSLASNASRMSTKTSPPRSDKSEVKQNKNKLKRQVTPSEQNRSRRSSVATVAESVDNRSVENRSQRGSVITLAELQQDSRSRRSSVNTLGENLETRSRRSSVITLGDAFENMMRGSRNTLAESPSNRSQRSSPHSRSPSLRSSPHHHMEQDGTRSRTPAGTVGTSASVTSASGTSQTPRRASVAAMGDSIDSTGTIKERRRASCSDFSETTHDSRERVATLQQQHSFPFGKQEEKQRRPSCASIEVVDQFLSRRSSLQVNQNDGLEDVRSRSGSRSHSRTPSPNIARRDSIPIQRTPRASPRASPKQIPDEDVSDDDTFRPISEIPDSTTRVIEWKKGLDKEKPSNDLNEKKPKRIVKSPNPHANVKESRYDHEFHRKGSHKVKNKEQNATYVPMQEYRSSDKRRASDTPELSKSSFRHTQKRRASVYAETALRSLSEEDPLSPRSNELSNFNYDSLDRSQAGSYEQRPLERNHPERKPSARRPSEHKHSEHEHTRSGRRTSEHRQQEHRKFNDELSESRHSTDRHQSHESSDRRNTDHRQPDHRQLNDEQSDHTHRHPAHANSERRNSEQHVEQNHYNNRSRDYYYDDPPPSYTREEWTAKPKPRRASIHTDDRRSFEPYFMVRDNHGFHHHHHIEPPVYYRDSEAELMDQIYREQIHRQATMPERKLPETPKQDRGRRHSLIGIQQPQPYYYVDKPPTTKQSKRRAASVALVSHDPEELIQLLEAENRQIQQHPSMMQKRASLPVVEGLPAVYYPQMRDQFDPRAIPLNRTVHIAYPGPHIQHMPEQRPPPNYQNHQVHRAPPASFDESRTRSRNVTWQCDEVEEEEEDDAENSDVRSSLIKNKYMEIAT